MLELKNLIVSIGDKKILKGLNFTFEKGKVYAIMGPNGSGKSTLASTVMGHPVYEVAKKSKILFEGKDIKEMEPQERSQKGIFMSFQSPMSLSGVTIFQLLRYALHGTRDALALRQSIQKYAKALKIKEELLSRSLNEDFSGGEKKKMEVVQAAVLEPKLLFFDEIDTGVDVDALKTIANFMMKMHTSENTFVLITHYNRILKYIQPDVVLVLKDGEILKVGDKDLATKIEKDGYTNF